MKSWKTIMAILCIMLSLLMLLFACSHLFKDYEEHQVGENAYEKLTDDFVEPAEDSDSPKETESTSEKDGLLQIDWDGLKNENTEIIGWIHIPGAGISYPLLQGSDNSYYLTHLPTKEYAISGSIFMDCHNKPDLSDNNTIIYGHNMKDGTMFAALDEYQDTALYEQFPYFYIYLPEGNYEYQIFSCYTGWTDGIAYRYSFPEKRDFQHFIETLQSNAAYETGITLRPEDRIVTLSTCTNTNRNHRYLIHGKLIRKI